MLTREMAKALVDEMNDEAADIHTFDWEAVAAARNDGDENAEELAEEIGDAQAETFAAEFRDSAHTDELLARMDNDVEFNEYVLQYGGPNFFENLNKMVDIFAD